MRRGRSGARGGPYPGGASPVARHAVAAHKPPPCASPAPRAHHTRPPSSRLEVDAAAAAAAAAARLLVAKVAKVAKVAIHDLHTRDTAGSRGIAPSTADPTDRAIEGGHQLTSLEAPATSLASSAGGARGCDVEVGVGGAFPPCASTVRSARVERERLKEAYAWQCE